MYPSVISIHSNTSSPAFIICIYFICFSCLIVDYVNGGGEGGYICLVLDFRENCSILYY